MPQKEISGATLVERRTNQRGEVSYYKMEVFHRGLNEIRTVGDRKYEIAQEKAGALLRKWDEKWKAVLVQRELQNRKYSSKQAAEEETKQAQAQLEAMSTVLSEGITKPVTIRWNEMEDHSEFCFSKAREFPLVTFSAKGNPVGARKIDIPGAPVPTDTKYNPPLGLFDRLWAPRKRRLLAEASSRLDADNAEWRSKVETADAEQGRADQQAKEAFATFIKDRELFLAAQGEANLKVAAFKDAYAQRDPEAVRRYCQLLLDSSAYPSFVDIDFAVSVNNDNGIAVVECELPDKIVIPTLSRVTYVASSNERKEKHTAENERDRLYDSLLYQVALRTIFELLHGDTAGNLKAVVFNGWVDALNPATGNREHGCILSVQSSREEFEATDLSKVDPRACFRKLKGVSAAKLSGMTPIRPILQLERDDPRFIASHAVADSIQEGYNLATMDWEEFEHLVRELFEAEFARNGAEVRVTRASSDGGVDAIVLDPDPIHGGKIVVQAKRYTNTVGLSAVRDLYGTVINEGANRGILVSTANYGSESYEFVKGKPITLLDGSNLLSLLEKHGHKARIDLREAKIVNAQNAQR